MLFLDTLFEPQTLPSGESGVMNLMLDPHNKGNPTPPSLEGRADFSLLFLLEGDVLVRIHLSDFMQFWWVGTCTWSDLLKFLTVLLIATQNNHKPLPPQIVIHCWQILFKCCWIYMMDGQIALLVQTSAIPSSQSGDANHWLQALHRQIGVNDLL